MNGAMLRPRKLGLALLVFVGCLDASFFACVPAYSTDGDAGAPPLDGSIDARGDTSLIDGGPSPDGSLVDAGADARVDADASSDAPVVVEGVVGLGGSYPYDDTACSVRDGGVRCASGNDFGQLGRGGPDAGIPTQLAPVVDDAGNPFTGVSRVAVGDGFECALRGDEVFCWGANDYAQLGQGYASSSSAPFYTPAAVTTDGTSPLSATRAISANGYQACAIDADAGVTCWGENYFNQLCLPGMARFITVATPVPDLAGSLAIAAGGFHTCAILGDGHVSCCGRNEMDQAGQSVSSACFNGEPCVASAMAVPGVVGASSIAAGITHSCAVLTADGSIACWGKNDHGQLGIDAGDGDGGACLDLSDASFPCSSTPPVHVKPPGGGSFIQVAVTTIDTCGLTDGGQVWCWGSNGFGGLAQGPNADTSDSSMPHVVKTDDGTPLAQIVGIAGGDGISCAVQSGGTVYCWGLGDGELADGGYEAYWATATPL
jgi:alpha-tubulin suppressor-like RCC1 family protein